jgi:hypothetical protein
MIKMIKIRIKEYTKRFKKFLFKSQIKKINNQSLNYFKFFFTLI